MLVFAISCKSTVVAHILIANTKLLIRMVCLGKFYIQSVTLGEPWPLLKWEVASYLALQRYDLL